MKPALVYITQNCTPMYNLYTQYSRALQPTHGIEYIEWRSVILVPIDSTNKTKAIKRALHLYLTNSKTKILIFARFFRIKLYAQKYINVL